MMMLILLVNTFQDLHKQKRGILNDLIYLQKKKSALILCQLIGLYTPAPDSGFYSLIPGAVVSANFSPLKETFGQCFRVDWSVIRPVDLVVVIIAFLFVDLFDTLGTLIGVASQADLLDENGDPIDVDKCMTCDTVATVAGAVLGTSTCTTFVESAAGVGAGGRTGLTSVVVAACFAICLFLSPLASLVPSCATAPALIIVGFLMFESITELKFTVDNLAQTIPAYLCILTMPLFYSISEGICFGVISYVVIKMATGKAKEVKPLMYILAVLFVLKYIFL